MNYIGKEIEHIKYGKGIVIEQAGRLVTVDFPMHGKKIFRKREFEKHAGLECENDEKVLEFLHERKIRKLMHFTQLSNLDSILKEGLLPVNELESLNHRFVRNDNLRLDGLNNCTCVSIEYPNVRLLETFRQMIPDSKWVIIALDANLLCNHKNYYSKYNAGSNEMRHTVKGNIYADNFRDLYTESFSVNLSSGIRYCTRKNIIAYPYLPTSEQAEILIEGKISVGDIRTIYFQNQEDMDPFFKRSEHRSIEFIVDATMFNTYRDEYKLFSER